MMTREDTVRLGPKRPPVAVAVDEGGTGVMRIARPAWTDQADALRRAIAHVAPRLDVELVDVVGPTVSTALRASGWAEAAVVTSSLGGAPDRVVSPDGALATATIDRAEDGSEVVSVAVRCGDPLDEIVLRSYCIGAAHMALGWVRSESLAVDDDGIPLDLTIRSFGILRAVDTPAIDVRIEPSDQPPVNGSDAVFAAVAAAAWRAEGFLAGWPAKAARDAR
jgi:CO/xanthine dehydrogenase Mo-binding subunit